MGFVTFVGLSVLCALIVGVVVGLEFLQRRLGKRQPKAL